jgi:predicted PurR-regulated permease PerM
MNKNIEISTKTLLTLLTILLSIWFLLQVSSIVLTIFIALILALGLTPLVDKMCQKGLSRSLAVLLTYLFFILLIFGLFTLAISPMIQQTQRLVVQLPKFAAAVTLPGLESLQRQFIESVSKEISSISGNVLHVTLGIFSNALLVITILVLTFYFLVDLPRLKSGLIKLFSKKNQPKVAKTINELEDKIGSWLRGEAFLMFIIGLATYIGLMLLGIDYALSLALIAGLLEIVPVLGPLIAAVPALIVASAISPWATVTVVILYALIQQAENNLIVPKVMGRAVGFSPLVILIILLVGGKLLGVLGALLAIPITLMGFIIAKAILTVDWK